MLDRRSLPIAFWVDVALNLFPVILKEFAFW